MEALLEHLAPTVQRFGNRLCGPSPDAEEVLQETLLSIATHLPEYEGRASLTSWVFTLVRTACIRRRRGLKNRPALDADALPERADEAPSPEERAEAQELAILVRAALDSLSDEHREVLLLRDAEGLTAPEAAQVLGLTVEALKSRLHRARAALREALAPRLEREPPRVGCPDVALLLSRKLEGELRPADCAEMERHMEGCPSCTGGCDALRSALAACKASPTPELSPALRGRVAAAVRAWAKR